MCELHADSEAPADAAAGTGNPNVMEPTCGEVNA